MSRMNLAQWARNRGVPYRTANRWFHRNQLPEGVTARRTASGSIEVETDPLWGVDIHALVRRIHGHGYVVLTHTQAAQLGIELPPEPTNAPEQKTDKKGDR